MKYFSTLLLVFTSLFFTSCDVEPVDSELTNFLSEQEQQNNVGSPLFKANFNNATWTAQNTVVYISGGLIRLEASIGVNGEGFGFLLNGATTGSYPANDNFVIYSPANSEYGWAAFNPNNENENTGSITITSINTVNQTISGFFNFKGYWSNTNVTNIQPINFTNGVFQNLPYVTQSPTNDSFYAKVNGTEFVDTDILVTTIGVGTVDLIGIGARDAANNSITVGVNETLGVGSYTITPTNNNQVQATYVVNNVSKLAQSGNITITSKSATRIKGTFNFVTNGNPTATISQGTFDVEY